jgi:hypothetical protein
VLESVVDATLTNRLSNPHYQHLKNQLIQATCYHNQAIPTIPNCHSPAIAYYHTYTLLLSPIVEFHRPPSADLPCPSNAVRVEIVIN